MSRRLLLLHRITYSKLDLVDVIANASLGVTLSFMHAFRISGNKDTALWVNLGRGNGTFNVQCRSKLTCAGD